MTNTADDKRYLALVLASTFLQGSSFVANKIALHDVAPLWLASLRFMVAAASLVPFLALRRERRSRRRDLPMPWMRLCFIGLVQTAGVMAFLNTGLLTTTAPKAAILMASNPLLVALLSGLLLKETVRPGAWLGLGLAFAGVVICIGVDAVMTGEVGRGEVLVGAASVCWAVSTLAVKRMKVGLDAWEFSYWQMLFGAVALALIAAAKGQTATLPGSSGVWVAFLWLAIPASTGAMGLWFAALRLGGAVHTSGYLFLCPLFTAVISFVLDGKVLSAHEVVGGVLIGSGIFMVSRHRHRVPALRGAAG